MYFKSKQVSLIILGVTALLVSRAMFAFIDDPEGPNLLIVTVLAAIVWLLSLGLYVRSHLVTITGLKRLLLAVLVQMMIVTALHLLLR